MIWIINKVIKRYRMFGNERIKAKTTDFSKDLIIIYAVMSVEFDVCSVNGHVYVVQRQMKSRRMPYFPGILDCVVVLER